MFAPWAALVGGERICEMLMSISNFGTDFPAFAIKEEGRPSARRTEA